MLCVSVPCDKSLCGWSGLPCGWGYSYCGRGKSPRSCSGLPCGKDHAELCSTSDLHVHSDWVIGRLPFCLQNSSGPLFDEGVMHSPAGIMDRKADCVQSVACLFTIRAAV